MNVYQAFFNLKSGVSDSKFAEILQAYMAYLEERRELRSWRLLRRKLGLGPNEIGEYQLMMEFDKLDDLDRSFGDAAPRSTTAERMHHDVYKMIDKVTFCLFRDYPKVE
jgi:hypothetical protein